MRKSIELVLVVIFFLLFVEACKKDNNFNNDGYRIKVETLFNEYGEVNNTVNYLYSESKLSQVKYINENGSTTVNYTYGINRVFSDSQLSNDTINLNNGLLEYVFQNEKLMAINGIETQNDDTLRSIIVEYTYAGEKLAQFINYYNSYPLEKGVYEYKNDQLHKYAIYNYDNEIEEKWREDEFMYEGDKLAEQFSYLLKPYADTVSLIAKLNFQYDNDEVKKRETFLYNGADGSWIPRTYTDYFYDDNANLVKEELRNASDSSLRYYYVYQYEVGQSNFGTHFYGGSSSDLRFAFPTPN